MLSVHKDNIHATARALSCFLSVLSLVTDLKHIWLLSLVLSHTLHTSKELTQHWKQAGTDRGRGRGRRTRGMKSGEERQRDGEKEGLKERKKKRRQGNNKDRRNSGRLHESGSAVSL